MNIYYSIEDFPADVNTIVTIGTFDGVHKGHRAIINRINRIAKKEGLESFSNVMQMLLERILYYVR